jgi:Molecular chaperone
MLVEQCCMYPLKCFMVPVVLSLLIPVNCSKTCLFRSCVALSGKNRILGVAAKNQMVTNVKNTIYGFKRLLGRKFNDPHVEKELNYLPFQMIKQPNGSIGIKVCL